MSKTTAEATEGEPEPLPVNKAKHGLVGSRDREEKRPLVPGGSVDVWWGSAPRVRREALTITKLKRELPSGRQQR
jgi:hypothetical protein